MTKINMIYSFECGRDCSEAGRGKAGQTSAMISFANNLLTIRLQMNRLTVLEYTVCKAFCIIYLFIIYLFFSDLSSIVFPLFYIYFCATM